MIVFSAAADGLVQRPVQSCLALGQVGGHGQGHSGGDGCHDDGGSLVLSWLPVDKIPAVFRASDTLWLSGWSQAPILINSWPSQPPGIIFDPLHLKFKVEIFT